MEYRVGICQYQPHLPFPTYLPQDLSLLNLPAFPRLLRSPHWHGLAGTVVLPNAAIEAECSLNGWCNSVAFLGKDANVLYSASQASARNLCWLRAYSVLHPAYQIRKIMSPT